MIQQFKFLLPSSFDARHHLPLITSERDILLVDIPVAGFQFLNQPAFRHLPVPDQPVISDIIGQRCDKQGIFSEAVAHLMQFPQIGSYQRIRLRFRHIGCQFLVGKNLVTVPHIRKMVSVPALMLLDTGHRLVEQPGIRREIPVWANSRGTTEKGNSQRANSLLLIRQFCCKDRFLLSAE